MQDLLALLLMLARDSKRLQVAVGNLVRGGGHDGAIELLSA
jgi:hypothetical protein